MDFADEQQAPADCWSLVDGALDTLGCIFQTMGSESFELGTDIDSPDFQESCQQAVRHIENGSAVPQLEIDQADAGTRNWAHLRRFYVDRRQQEKLFVTGQLKNYRGVVEDLVIGLREICKQGDLTEQQVMRSLNAIEAAVDGGQLADIQRVLFNTIRNVNDAFTRQKSEYEQQIHGLNERMAGLRQDLVVAHEEMKLDPLTSIFNRGAFDSSVERCLNMHFVLNQDVSLIMIDVDNFKQINDTFGHTVGDDVLRSLSACLSRSFIRKNDLIARYGGDEFAVLLPDTSADQSQVSIDRFLDSVRKIRVDALPAGFSISCSAGCTEILDDDCVESLVARADEALYDAKQAGRDCLRFR